MFKSLSAAPSVSANNKTMKTHETNILFLKPTVNIGVLAYNIV